MKLQRETKRPDEYTKVPSYAFTILLSILAIDSLAACIFYCAIRVAQDATSYSSSSIMFVNNCMLSAIVGLVAIMMAVGAGVGAAQSYEEYRINKNKSRL